jgi:hypothetical protein
LSVLKLADVELRLNEVHRDITTESDTSLAHLRVRGGSDNG